MCPNPFRGKKEKKTFSDERSRGPLSERAAQKCSGGSLKNHNLKHLNIDKMIQAGDKGY